MKLEAIEQEARGLSQPERALLVLALAETLGAGEPVITDEEVARRDEELQQSAGEPISHADFLRQAESCRAQ